MLTAGGINGSAGIVDDLFRFRFIRYTAFHMNRKSPLVRYIAAAAGILFLALLFGYSSVFPRIFIFDMFSFGFGGSPSISVPSSPAGENQDSTIILDIVPGNGTQAGPNSTVGVGYIGTFVNDAGEEVEFDRNMNPSAPAVFTLGVGQVISGFEKGIIGMREGGQRIVIISPEDGYGNRQVDIIPPNTTLQFVIELYEVR